MTVRNTTIAALSATLLVALPMAVGVAHAESSKAENKQIVELDQTATGSIERADSFRSCDPDSPTASAICKITGGNPGTKFPSAPISNFGI